MIIVLTILATVAYLLIGFATQDLFQEIGPDPTNIRVMLALLWPIVLIMWGAMSIFPQCTRVTVYYQKERK